MMFLFVIFYFYLSLDLLVLDWNFPGISGCSLELVGLFCNLLHSPSKLHSICIQSMYWMSEYFVKSVGC